MLLRIYYVFRVFGTKLSEATPVKAYKCMLYSLNLRISSALKSDRQKT